MNLRTNYLAVKLRTPLVPSASPLSENLDNIKQMEDAGAAALVLHPLFQEHIFHESTELHHRLMHGTDSFAEIDRNKNGADSVESGGPSPR